MGFLLMLGRRMRLRPKAETGLLLLLHEWTVNTQNTSTLLTQAQRQRGSRRPASWIPRVDRARKHLTWAPVSLRKCSSSLLGWCERKWREEPQTLLQCQLPSAGSEQQPGGRSNMHPAPPPPPSVCRVFDLLSCPTVFRSHHASYFGAQYFQASVWKKYSWWWR